MTYSNSNIFFTNNKLSVSKYAIRDNALIFANVFHIQMCRFKA